MALVQVIRVGDAIRIGAVTVKVTQSTHRRATLAIEAPTEVPIERLRPSPPEGTAEARSLTKDATS